MFKHILVPFELVSKEKSKKSAKAATDLAGMYDAKVTLVTVSGSFDGMITHSLDEKQRLLEAYAAQLTQSAEVEVDSRIYEAADTAAEVVRRLIDAIEDTGADLVVMASHQPGWVEYLVNSNAGRVASHAPVSVFVVRD